MCFAELQGIERNSPSRIRYNTEDRSRRHRGVPNSSFEKKPLHDYHARNRATAHTSQNHQNKGFESRSFKDSKEDDVNKSYENTVRFQRNLPFNNVPELNFPFGENGDHFMEFLSQIGSNNRPFGDIGFGERSDLKTEKLPTTKLIPQFKKSPFSSTFDYPSEYYSDKQVVTSEKTDHIENSFLPSLTSTTSGYLTNTKLPSSYYNTESPRRRTSLEQHSSRKTPSRQKGFKGSDLSILNEISELKQSYQNNNEIVDEDYSAYYDQRRNPFLQEKSRKRKVNHEDEEQNTPLPLAYDPNQLYNTLNKDITDGYDEAEAYNDRLNQEKAYDPIQPDVQEPIQHNALINPYQYPVSHTNAIIETSERNQIADINKPLRFPTKERESSHVVPTFNPAELSQKINGQGNVKNTARNYYNSPYQESYHHTLKSYREPIGSKERQKGDVIITKTKHTKHVTHSHSNREEIAARSVLSTNKKVNNYPTKARTKPIQTTTVATTSASHQTSRGQTSSLLTEQSSSTSSDSNSGSEPKEIATTPRTRVIYTPGPVYYKDMPLVTSTPDPAVVLDKLTAPVNNQPYKNKYKGNRNRAKIPRYIRKDGKGQHYRRKEASRKSDEGYFYRDNPYQARETSIPITHDRVDTQQGYKLVDENSSNVDSEGYYYRDITYQNHPKKDIDGNPDNDWIPIFTRKNDLVRHRLQKSPLKKLVNNVKESLFRSDTSVSTAAAISLPYLALALPN